MSPPDSGPLTRELLLEYFLGAARPREDWLVGMELEKLGRAARDGSAIPHHGARGPSVRRVLEAIQQQRGGEPIFEGDYLIGLDAPWGTISLEPGGQVEWSSRPAATLPELASALDAHLAVMGDVARALAVRWLDVAVDPDLPLDAMSWMPKARYKIMRPFLAARGRLAERMMSQTASIQCAFDYSDPDDWLEKFRLGALLAPVATALFANSSRIDGADSSWASYRSAIWRETDPARSGVPAVVFEDGFDIARWLDHVLSVPTIFRHRARGLVPAGGVPFRELLERRGCDAIGHDDWETHISTIFTEVRSYTYIEVRSADLQTDANAFEVPTFWTGLLYHDESRRAALSLVDSLAGEESWSEAMVEAGRGGMDARIAGRPLRELAGELVGLARSGLRAGAPCAGDPERSVPPLERLAERRGLQLD